MDKTGEYSAFQMISNTAAGTKNEMRTENFIQILDTKTNGCWKRQIKIVIMIQEIFKMSSAFSGTQSEPIVKWPMTRKILKLKEILIKFMFILVLKFGKGILPK